MASKKTTSAEGVVIGVIGHVDHGKTTLLEALTGKWADEHSEELKRGITIRLGYASRTIHKCPKCAGAQAYQTTSKCLKHGTNNKEVRTFYFIDAPGHETLMATMLSGAAIIDGAILVISANEKCPQPQTREHLMALEILGLKKIIIVQNKIDLVSEEQAKKNHEEIKKFVKGTVAENAPIIPVSAQHRVNIDALLKAMIEVFTPVERDLTSDPVFLVARSFDVNKPGTPITELKGGVFGGILKKGVIKKKDEITVLPGVKEIVNNQETWTPLKTVVEELSINTTKVNNIQPGVSAGIRTSLDPSLTRADSLAGSVVCLRGKETRVHHELKLKVRLLERVVGTEQELKTEPLKTNETLMINAWTTKTLGVITSIKKDELNIKLRTPVCIETGERIALSKRVNNRWRLIGMGEVLD